MARRGCQRDIAQKVIGKKADYVLALKGNQSSLPEDVDHGRIENRTTTVIHDVGWLQERHAWPGLKAVVMVESSRDVNAPKVGADEPAPLVAYTTHSGNIGNDLSPGMQGGRTA